jgi:hypothetical protein
MLLNILHKEECVLFYVSYNQEHFESSEVAKTVFSNTGIFERAEGISKNGP